MMPLPQSYLVADLLFKRQESIKQSDPKSQALLIGLACVMSIQLSKQNK